MAGDNNFQTSTPGGALSGTGGVTGLPGSEAQASALNDSLASLKDAASDATEHARAGVTALADQAKGRIAELADQQKAAGAEAISGFARAAKSAAGDLEQTSPSVARVVREAADGVDRIANDLKNSDLSDLLNTLNQFARSQPVAFFGGSVLAGLVIARFLKSAPNETSEPVRYTPPKPAPYQPRPSTYYGREDL